MGKRASNICTWLDRQWICEQCGEDIPRKCSRRVRHDDGLGRSYIFRTHCYNDALPDLEQHRLDELALREELGRERAKAKGGGDGEGGSSDERQ